MADSRICHEERERNCWTPTQAERVKAKMTSEKSLQKRVLGCIPGIKSAPLPLVTASRILGHLGGLGKAANSAVVGRAFGGDESSVVT